MDLMTFLFGSGIIGLLFTISHDIGKIRGGFDAINGTLRDHGQRISKLEQERNDHEKLA